MSIGNGLYPGTMCTVTWKEGNQSCTITGMVDCAEITTNVSMVPPYDREAQRYSMQRDYIMNVTFRVFDDGPSITPISEPVEPVDPKPQTDRWDEIV